MNKHIYWMLQLNINPGHYEDFKTLMQEMVSATEQNEPNALNYEWWINEEKTSCHIYERYANADALMTHLGNFGSKFAERFMSHVVPTSFIVYGDVTNDVKTALDGLNPSYMSSFGGFNR